MRDEHFIARQKEMIFYSEIYLLIAALIPLLGAALMISNQSSSRIFTLAAVGAGVAGLLLASFAYRLVVMAWSRMAEVLATSTTAVPVEK